MRIIIKEQIDRGEDRPLYQLEIQDPGHIVESYGVGDLTERRIINEIKGVLKQNKKRRQYRPY